MANALDVAKQAVKLWRDIRGNESTYLQCQRYDGYYWQWAYQGNESGIKTYASAQIAADNSDIYTRDLNSADARAGDAAFWRWGSQGHVGTVIGKDGGRTLLTHTSRAGDEVMDLGNHARVSHADTISLDVIGLSRANGRNRERSGLEAYNAGGGGTTSPSAGGGSQIDLRDGWAWYNSASDAERQVNPHGPKWTGERLARGVYAVLSAPNAVQIRANDGSSIWVSPEARGRISGGAPAPAPEPARQLWIDLDGWAWYNSDGDAYNERNPHGPNWTGERLLSGTYPVAQYGSGGAIQVRANDGSYVWVSPKAGNRVR